MNLSKFIANSSIDAKLIRSTVRQFGGWKAFTQGARDVVYGGAAGGFHGFIWHTDTVAFTRRNKGAIVALCASMADDLGESGAIALIIGFMCLKGYTQEQVADGLYNSRSEDRTQIYNALAWFALEEVARSYMDLKGE